MLLHEWRDFFRLAYKQDFKPVTAFLQSLNCSFNHAGGSFISPHGVNDNGQHGGYSKSMLFSLRKSCPSQSCRDTGRNDDMRDAEGLVRRSWGREQLPKLWCEHCIVPVFCPFWTWTFWLLDLP
jgi:hypothetical protein